MDQNSLLILLSQTLTTTEYYVLIRICDEKGKNIKMGGKKLKVQFGKVKFDHWNSVYQWVLIYEMPKNKTSLISYRHF